MLRGEVRRRPARWGREMRGSLACDRRDFRVTLGAYRVNQDIVSRIAHKLVRMAEHNRAPCRV